MITRTFAAHGGAEIRIRSDKIVSVCCQTSPEHSLRLRLRRMT